MRVWFYVDDCGEDPTVPWESSEMTVEQTERFIVETWVPVTDQPVELTQVFTAKGDTHFVVADAEELDLFRQFIRDHPSFPPV